MPDAATYRVMSVNEDGSFVVRPAEQADLRHCASCTCPPASDSAPPTTDAEEARTDD